jgi:hypothetical protein
MHQCEGASARLRQHPSLSNPILKKSQLHRFRPISLEVVRTELACVWAATRCAFTRWASAALSRHTSAQKVQRLNPAR